MYIYICLYVYMYTYICVYISISTGLCLLVLQVIRWIVYVPVYMLVYVHMFMLCIYRHSVYI